MAQEKLDKILAAHKQGGGADLCRADLSEADLSEADLRWADLSGADLRWANLIGADLSGANLRGAYLRGAYLIAADLSGADLSRANLHKADLSGANLRRANLIEADLSGANLGEADLSGATGLLSAVDFLEAHFERVEAGYIAYKTFNVTYEAPAAWEIKKGAVISENVNFDRCTECGCGVNVAPLEWVKREYGYPGIWKVLIRWEWLCGVCVPYMSDGKIRCERVELLEVVM